MLGATLLQLRGFTNVAGSLCWHGHPLNRVRVMGVVVKLVFKEDRFASFFVDDGSALLPCIWWAKDAERHFGEQAFRARWPGLALGDLVSVSGHVAHYRGERQLQVLSADVETDPNAEALWHAELVHFGALARDEASARPAMERDEHAAQPDIPSTKRARWQRNGLAELLWKRRQDAEGDPDAVAQGPPDTEEALFEALMMFCHGRDDFTFRELQHDAPVRAAVLRHVGAARGEAAQASTAQAGRPVRTPAGCSRSPASCRLASSSPESWHSLKRATYVCRR